MSSTDQPSDGAGHPPSLSETVRGLWELLKAYAKQETVGPLKGLGLYVGIGLGAAAATAIGLLLLLLGLLRLVQTEAPRLVDSTGRSSVWPYFIVVLVSGALIALLAWRIPKEFD